MQENSEAPSARGGPDPDASPPSGPWILGVVLAGGLSSRMGREKAFVLLDGRPLLAHVLERFAPQVGRVVINANGDPTRFAAFGCDVVPDGDGTSEGPLSGIAAGLRLARSRGAALMATCPSDAPRLPRRYVARLVDAIGENRAACLAGETGLEPLFGLWRVEALADLETALAEGRRAVRDAMAAIGGTRVPAEPGDDLANLNTPSDLEAAQAGSGAAARA
jgi:molybdenum cofactor guanylyltransferase